MKLKYDQTTARQDVLGITRTRESPGNANRQERRIARKSEAPGQKNRQEKRSARENAKRRGNAKRLGNAKRRGNAKKKRAHLGSIDGASDSVSNHVEVSDRRGINGLGNQASSWLYEVTLY